MSYCRWSSDDWSSDIYCYESCNGGWDIHVASNRIIGDIPKSGHLFGKDMDAYMKIHRKQMKFLETAEHKDIGLEYDGEIFNESTPLLAAQRLIELRETGYIVPQYAIDALMREE